MTWASFYLICFVVGLLFSLLAFFTGSPHFHLPHIHLHVSGHVGHAGGSGAPSPLNFGTLAAFLTWFGGAGYLLAEYSALWVMFALGIAVACGLAGSALVFWFLAKVLMRDDNELELDDDTGMVGVLGRVSSAVRPGGTGEMIFSRAGARRASPIRSEDGAAIPRDTEVVVTRFEKGIAYVRPWEELTGAANM